MIRQRMVFQTSCASCLEQVTGRKLIGLVGKQQDRDIICEFFVLAPNAVTG